MQRKTGDNKRVTMIPQQPPCQPVPKVTLGILAGGHGCRLGTRDKGLVTLAGQPLVGRLLGGLEELPGDVVVNCRFNAHFYAHYAPRLVCDAAPNAGPCFGIAALLAACETPLLWVLPVDLRTDVAGILPQLVAALPVSGHGSYLCNSEGRHGLVLLLRRDTLLHVSRYLADGGRSVTGLLTHLGATPVPGFNVDDVDSSTDLLGGPAVDYSRG